METKEGFFYKGEGLTKFKVIDENQQQNWVTALKLWVWISAEFSASVRCCSSLFSIEHLFPADY